MTIICTRCLYSKNRLLFKELTIFEVHSFVTNYESIAIMSNSIPRLLIQRRRRNTGSTSPSRESRCIRARLTSQYDILTNTPTDPAPSIRDETRDPSVSTGIRCNHRYQPLSMNLRNEII